MLAVIAIGVVSAALIFTLRPDDCRSFVIDGQGTHSTPERVISSAFPGELDEFTKQDSSQSEVVFTRRGHRYHVALVGDGLWALDSIIC
jgi:hypothetical protein